MKTIGTKIVTLFAVICLGIVPLGNPAKASIYDANVVQRLELSGAQKREMEKVIAASRAQRNRIFRKYGIDPNAKPQMELLQRASAELMANAARERAAAKKILTRRQLQRYDAIMAEIRQRIISSF
jgi:hypothetical protein